MSKNNSLCYLKPMTQDELTQVEEFLNQNNVVIVDTEDTCHQEVKPIFEFLSRISTKRKIKPIVIESNTFVLNPTV